MRAPLLSAALLLSTSCTLTLDYNQCETNQDCVAKNSTPATPYCTSDKICVTDTPVELLCDEAPYPEVSKRTRVSRIGALLNVSKDGNSGADQYRLLMIKAAVEEINTQVAAFSETVGTIELYICHINSPADTVNALRELSTKRQIVAAIGPSTEPEVKQLIDASATLQVPVLLPAATADALSMVSKRAFAFFLAPLDKQQAPSMASAVPNRQTVTVITQQGSYGRSLQGAFVSEYNRRDAMNNMGISVPAPFADSDEGIAQLQTLAQMLAPQIPIVSYMTLLITPTRVGAVTALQSMPYDSKNASKTTQFISSDGGRSGPMLELARQVQQAALAAPMDMTVLRTLNNFRRLRGISPTPLVNNATTSSFRTPFLTKNPGFEFGRDLYMTFAYDAVYTAALAIDSVNLSAGTAVTGADVANVLRLINNNGKEIASLGYAAYPTSVAKISKKEPVQLEGLTGVIGFDTDGTRQGAQYETWWIEFEQDRKTPTGKDPTFVNTDPRAVVGM